MNNRRLKIFGILLLTTFSQILFPMKQEDDFQPQANLSILPLELKTIIVEYCIIDHLSSDISNYIDMNFDLDDKANLEQNLFNLMIGFPNFISTLAINKVDKTFQYISLPLINNYFRYFLALKLSKLDLEEKKKLISKIKSNNRCLNLIVVLVIYPL